MNESNNDFTSAYLGELLATVAIAGVVYLVGLMLLKEDLISSFVRKKPSESLKQ
jgi:hypothetical protein